MVGLGTSKGNAECYWKSPDISPGKSQDNRATSYSKKKPLRKQKAYAAEEDTDDEGEEIVGLVAEHALSPNRRRNWVNHSGATCYMCNNEEL